MIFWLLAAALTALVVAVLVLPLLRRPADPDAEGYDARSAYDQTVYRDQLRELQEDQRRGLLPAEEADAAKREVERRLLRSDAEAQAGGSTASSAPLFRRLGAAFIVLLMPLAGVGIYLGYGTPGLPGLPFAERQGGSSQEAEMLVAQLEARLAGNPEDAEGWLVLARVYERMARYGQAAEAYRRIIELGRGGAEVHASLGEVLVAEAGGQVGRDARLAFARAIEMDPANPRARYYAGMAMAQDDRLADALAVWRGLEADSPPDAPWRPLLERQIANAAASLGEATPETIPETAPGAGNEAPRGPSAADIEAMQALSPEERDQFIRSMVEGLAARLEEQPDNPEGWLQLARSYTVLGDVEAAGRALERAAPLVEAMPADTPGRAALQQRLEALRATLP
ncbi:c-type cytochrome biogenesis protein CcmI [Pelagibius sp.]|uniref:c-type cytochrome biogenesis protein CcmI n=1 Tax=Pelagibius sp. TaxID=1931238 RepID=UPI0026073221|nr:c-type cytochrome biogenesis protein CcmI [Pelagibius sp.]